MALSDLALATRYRSNETNLVKDFYIPCLTHSVLYQRAVGYFTSSGLSLAAKGLAAFLKGNGTMQLVASPFLTEDDERAIAEGHRDREQVLVESLIRQLESVSDEMTLSRLACLAQLVATKRLDIQLANKIDVHGRLKRGIYHEKIGIFTDEDGNSVAFTGSSNETAGGLVENFESVHVFCSWDDPQNRVRVIKDDFSNLWNNMTTGLVVLPFPEAAKKGLIRHLRAEPPTVDPDEEEAGVQPFTSQSRSQLTLSTFKPWPHQLQAVDMWISHNCRGILQMATGAGKTKTAVLAIQRVTSDLQPGLVVIVAPYKHLLEQWSDECERWSIRHFLCSSDYPEWPNRFNDLRLSLAAGEKSLSAVLVTYNTFTSDRFQSILERCKVAKMLIADEVHHLGSSSSRIPLEGFAKRLGLSATPQRIYDSEGTQWMTDNVGPIIFRFDIKDAIPRFLCPYDYFIHCVYLDPHEQQEFQEVMAQITRACASGGSIVEEDPEANKSIGPLLRKRQEIIGGASGKLPKLLELIGEQRTRHGPNSINFSLFYSSERLFAKLVDELSNTVRLRISKFTFAESREERAQILENFANERIQGIVAMKCLDEGMDIPATRNAFILASSSNPMEYVQRRGRVLRNAPGKDHATIHDLFVLPAPDSSINDYDRRLVERELIRAKEFASTSRNPVSAGRTILEVQKRYQLLHL